MTYEGRRDVSPRALERHIQTILTAFIVALLAWMAATIQGNSIKLAEVAVHLQRLNRTEAEVVMVKERLARMETELALIRRSLSGKENDRLN